MYPDEETLMEFEYKASGSERRWKRLKLWCVEWRKMEKRVWGVKIKWGVWFEFDETETAKSEKRKKMERNEDLALKNGKKEAYAKEDCIWEMEMNEVNLIWMNVITHYLNLVKK